MFKHNCVYSHICTICPHHIITHGRAIAGFGETRSSVSSLQNSLMLSYRYHWPIKLRPLLSDARELPAWQIFFRLETGVQRNLFLNRPKHQFCTNLVWSAIQKIEGHAVMKTHHQLIQWTSSIVVALQLPCLRTPSHQIPNMPHLQGTNKDTGPGWKGSLG